MRGYMKASMCKKRLCGEVFLRKFVFSRVTVAVSKNLQLVASCVLDLHIQVSSHLRSSHLTSSHPHDICGSSHLRSSHLRFSYRRIFQSADHSISDLRIVASSTSSNPHLRSSYLISSHLQHICASSYLSPFNPHLVFISSDLHRLHILSSSRFQYAVFTP